MMCTNISFHKIPLSDIFFNQTVQLLKQNFALFERVYLVNMADIKALEYSTMKVSKLQ